MRAEDRGIPRLDGHDAFEENGRRGIGDWRKRKDDADRLGDLDDAPFRKLANHANRTFVFYVVVNKLGGHHVLEGFVFEHSKPGFLNRQASEVLSLLKSGHNHRLNNVVDVLLRELGEDGGGGSGLADQPFEVGDPLLIQAWMGSRSGNPTRTNHLAHDHDRPFQLRAGPICREALTALHACVISRGSGFLRCFTLILRFLYLYA